MEKNYVALGDFVLDIYHDNKGGLLGYYAGGSAWNDLINISNLETGANCFCIATCGKDWAGDFIIETLHKHGIDTSHVTKIKRQTKRYNIIIDGSQTKSQLECPECKRKTWYSSSSIPTEMPAYFTQRNCGVVIIDSLKKNVIELASSFRNNGWFVAADIGYINHLCYVSKANARTLLCGRFDLLQLNSRSLPFIMNKFSCNSEIELFETLNCKYLSITHGDQGSKLLYRDQENNIKSIPQEAVCTSVVDPTGAGDAYFSKILLYVSRIESVSINFHTIIKEASLYASNRVSVIGAVGTYAGRDVSPSGCSKCGLAYEEKPATIKKRKQRIATNVDHLLDRTMQALESEAVVQLKKILLLLRGQVLMVGTGGSFAAAVFAAKCVTQFHPEAYAIACHPRDVLIRGLDKVNTVFLFSYSGKTKDIQRVFELCVDNNIPAYIVTKLTKEDSIGSYDQESLITYSSPPNVNTKERGFISMAGTLIPMCIFGDVHFPKGNGDFKKFLEQCFRDRSQEEYFEANCFSMVPKRTLSVDIFSGYDTLCSALDLESKLIESGLARVVIHEKKDFSHGRFNILENAAPDLLFILDNVKGQYSKTLLNYLEKRITVCRLVTEFGPIWGDLDLLIAVEYLAKHLSTALDYDMAKPEYPKDAMRLYRYSGKDML